MSTASGLNSAAAFNNDKAVIETYSNSTLRCSDEDNLAQLFDEQKTENENLTTETKTINIEKLSSFDHIKFDFIESSLNYQGNYQNYVYKAMQSISNLYKLDYTAHIKKLAQVLPDTSRKTLILDLDETLIHADFDAKYTGHDYTITFMYEDEKVNVPIFIRPNLNEFLESVNELFEIVIFTAAKKEYADAVLNFLDPDSKFFKLRFYRENCINIKNKVFIKDLRIFKNRNQENIIILDNSMYSFGNQLSNGILINSFYNDKSDKELNNALAYVVNYLHKAQDVRIINNKIFNFSSIIEQFSQATKKISREI